MIAGKMVDYLRSTQDEVAKADVVARISELAERYAPDTLWFIRIMTQVRSCTISCVHDNLLRLFALLGAISQHWCDG